MTSLIGASGEDFASILRALGYRMERRPKPPDQPPPAATGAPPAHETSEIASAEASPAGELPGVQAAAADSGAESSASGSAEPVLEQPNVSAVDDGATANAAVAPPAAEPEMIEVWRPSRTGDRRRVHARARGRAKHGEATVPAPESASAAVAAKEGAALIEPTAEPDANGRPRRPGRQRRPQHRMDRQEQPQRERSPGKRFEPREKRPDPNSPFAKLAALKAQLEADTKERH
jgi:ATP-dependent RNA helicase SUPV3L1/SUV3